MGTLIADKEGPVGRYVEAEQGRQQHVGKWIGVVMQLERKDVQGHYCVRSKC
jgi:hypothetical protein